MFKFEKRKAWDILLESFFEAFTSEDNVALYIVTHAYHDDTSPRAKVELFKMQFVARQSRELASLPAVVLLDEHIPQTQLPALYAAANFFVLPSRGEGWGRPHSEAMAMGLVTIATNWSGNTEFMRKDNSFLIPIEGLEEVREGAFATHRWAKPSQVALTSIMRHVFENNSDLGSMRLLARETMLQYHPDKIAALIHKLVDEKGLKKTADA